MGHQPQKPQFVNEPNHEAALLEEYPDAFTLKELCELLQICTKTARRLLNSGEIRCLRIGRSFCIPKPYLLSYIYGTLPEDND